MSEQMFCKIKTKCSICPKASESVMSIHNWTKGYHLPANKCEQNNMIFVTKGELLVNSKEYAGTKISANHFILQAIGSKIEILAMTDVECIIYHFNEPYLVCEERYRKAIENAEAPLIYSPLKTIPALQLYLENIKILIDDNIICKDFWEIKQKELNFILNCYYSLRDLYTLYAPISSYTNSLHYFVMQNYNKVKTVEELAHLGGYSITTFRRMFKNLFHEPAYEWMLKQKRDGIMEDLTQTNLTITEISIKYGFDTLPHFSNFCKTCFGDSPRALRKKIHAQDHKE